MITEKMQEEHDYRYMEKLNSKNERQLKAMLDSLSKEIAKLNADKTRLDRKLKERTKRQHFIKNALMDMWREPSQELKEAIREVQNGEDSEYNSVSSMMEDLKQ